MGLEAAGMAEGWAGGGEGAGGAALPGEVGMGGRPEGEASAEEEAILILLDTLEKQYRAGQIPGEYYEKRRKALLKRLEMARSKEQGEGSEGGEG